MPLHPLRRSLLLALSLFAPAPAPDGAHADDAACAIPSAPISDPARYVGIFHCGNLVGKVQARALVGRVLKGKADADFETLSYDASRKLVFLMGEDGLAGLAGLGNDAILEKIGYTKEYIDRLKKEGTHFKLVVFRARGEAGLPAEWDNVARLATKAYPDLAPKIARALPELKRRSFRELEAQAPTKFAAVDAIGASHPEYIDEKKLAAREGKPWEVRAFLYYRARLMELYAGDGYTRTPDGKKGLREYVVLNQAVRSLPDAAVGEL